jgi:nucleoside-diphosphate-sugar epimerase
MRVGVLGAGSVGVELGRRLRQDGCRVVGTSTTRAKANRVAGFFDAVRVVHGADSRAVANLLRSVDALAVCAGPRLPMDASPTQRSAAYQDAIATTAATVVAAVRATGMSGPVIALSSFAVYGSAADNLTEVTEDAPLAAALDPAPVAFQQAERHYLEGLPGQACVLRCAEMYGGGDAPIELKVRLAHEILGGALPASGDALYYRVHVTDVAEAVRFAIGKPLTGVYNLTHAQQPGTVRACYDAIAAAIGLGPLTYRGEIPTPARPVSVARLAEAGFGTRLSTVAAAR